MHDDLLAVLRLRRRELLELIVLALALPGCKRKHDEAPAPTHVAPVPATALDAAAVRTLDAVTLRMLPGDGTIPSARDAGVVAFIDRQLAIQPLAKLAPAMIALCRALDDAARARGASEVAKLPIATQDALVEALSRGTLGSTLPERELFRVLHGFVLEGLLSDPHHGGNLDQRGWRAIGFPEPSLRVPGEHHH